MHTSVSNPLTKIVNPSTNNEISTPVNSFLGREREGERKRRGKGRGKREESF